MRTPSLEIITLSFILLCSCSNNSADDFSSKDEQIPQFLETYKPTTVPIIMKGCFGDSYALPLINDDDLHSDNEDGSVPYCTFKTNGDYYAVIRLGLAGSCAFPFLITYDKNGEVIDQKSIAIGWCGAGPGFYCEEFASIKSNFSIYASDTITEAEIDSLGHEIEATRKSYVLYIQGNLLKSGKIELSDTIRQILKK